MVSQKDFLGTIQTDPMNFKPFGLQKIEFLVDGRSYPTLGWKTKFDTTGDVNYTQAFLSLFKYNLRNNDGCPIDIGNYITGNCIFGFDFGQAGACDGEYLTFPRKLGTPRLSLLFDANLSEPIKLIIHAEWNETLAIDSLRQIHRNYTL